ncbi:hypothetical protein FHG87_004509 [Trinorchestia longiramus]|nr:hypothetical protein FHG87_004509 [Trinorchestia longiramus]
MEKKILPGTNFGIQFSTAWRQGRPRSEDNLRRVPLANISNGSLVGDDVATGEFYSDGGVAEAEAPACVWVENTASAQEHTRKTFTKTPWANGKENIFFREESKRRASGERTLNASCHDNNTNYPRTKNDHIEIGTRNSINKSLEGASEDADSSLGDKSSCDEEEEPTVAARRRISHLTPADAIAVNSKRGTRRLNLKGLIHPDDMKPRRGGRTSSSSSVPAQPQRQHEDKTRSLGSGYVTLTSVLEDLKNRQRRMYGQPCQRSVSELPWVPSLNIPNAVPHATVMLPSAGLEPSNVEPCLKNPSEPLYGALATSVCRDVSFEVAPVNQHEQATLNRGCFETHRNCSDLQAYNGHDTQNTGCLASSFQTPRKSNHRVRFSPYLQCAVSPQSIPDNGLSYLPRAEFDTSFQACSLHDPTSSLYNTRMADNGSDLFFNLGQGESLRGRLKYSCQPAEGFLISNKGCNHVPKPTCTPHEDNLYSSNTCRKKIKANINPSHAKNENIYTSLGEPCKIFAHASRVQQQNQNNPNTSRTPNTSMSSKFTSQSLSNQNQISTHGDSPFLEVNKSALNEAQAPVNPLNALFPPTPGRFYCKQSNHADHFSSSDAEKYWRNFSPGGVKITEYYSDEDENCTNSLYKVYEPNSQSPNCYGNWNNSCLKTGCTSYRNDRNESQQEPIHCNASSSYFTTHGIQHPDNFRLYNMQRDFKNTQNEDEVLSYDRLPSSEIRSSSEAQFETPHMTLMRSEDAWCLGSKLVSVSTLEGQMRLPAHYDLDSLLRQQVCVTSVRPQHKKRSIYYRQPYKNNLVGLEEKRDMIVVDAIKNFLVHAWNTRRGRWTVTWIRV